MEAGHCTLHPIVVITSYVAGGRGGEAPILHFIAYMIAVILYGFLLCVLCVT